MYVPQDAPALARPPWTSDRDEICTTKSGEKRALRPTVSPGLSPGPSPRRWYDSSVMVAPGTGPFTADQLHEGDRYELSRGHPIYCEPGGGRHAGENAIGTLPLATDPAVHEIGVDVGDSPGPADTEGGVFAIGYAQRRASSRSIASKGSARTTASSCQTRTRRHVSPSSR